MRLASHAAASTSGCLAPPLTAQRRAPRSRRASRCAAAGSKEAAPSEPSLGEPRGSVDAVDDWFYTENGQKTWVEAMELDSLTPELPQLLVDMGVRYDPDRLAEALSGRRAELAARSVQVAASLGRFIALVSALEGNQSRGG